MKAWKDLAKLPKELWILCLSTLVNRMGTMVMPFLVLYLTRSLKFSASKAGSALAVYGAVALLTNPLAGKLSDKFGPRRVIQFCLISSGIVLILFGQAKSWPAIIMMTALLSITGEAFRPAIMALVAELGPAEYRKSAFAMHRWAINLGMSIGPALGGFLAQVSFSLLFLVDGVTSLLGGMILIFSSFNATVRAHESQKREKAQIQKNEEVKKLGAIFSDPALRVFLLGVIPIALVFFQHESSMPLFLVRDLHFPESAFGLLFSVNTLLIIAIEIPLNAATSHWSHRRTMVLGCFLFALGFGALAFAHTFFQVAMTVVVWTFGEMILFPGMSAFVSDIAPENKRGEYMGLYLMAFSVAFMLGPWLGTVTLDHFGFKTLWASALVIGVISAAILALIKEKVK